MWARVAGVIAMLVSAGTEVHAQSVVGEPEPTVALFHPDTRASVGRVSTEGWKGRLEVRDVPGTTQFVAISYDGKSKQSSAAVAPGTYLVRRSQVMPVNSCTLTEVRAGDADVRHGRNAHGPICPKVK